MVNTSTPHATSHRPPHQRGPSSQIRLVSTPKALLKRIPKRFILLAVAVSSLLVVLSATLDSSHLERGSAFLRAPLSRTHADSASANQQDWLQDRPDGTVLVRKGRKGVWHPLRRLMAEAKEKWEKQLASQSTSLNEAIETYKRNYRRNPPKGFEAWWTFTQAKNVKIVDDYLSIHTAITPFLALSPIVLSARLASTLADQPFSFALSLRRHAPVTLTGDRATSFRPEQMAILMEGFRQWLPDDFGEGEGFVGEGLESDDGVVRWSGSDHDLGGRIMGDDFRERTMALAESGKYLDENELKFHENVGRDGALTSGLFAACSRVSQAGVLVEAKQDIILYEEEDELPPVTSQAVTFVHKPQLSYDFCRNPSLLPLHGTFSRDLAQSPALLPQFVLSKFEQSPQILMTPLEAFENVTLHVAWENKTSEKIFWRGSTTGDSFSHRSDGYDWRQSHRLRLHTLTNARSGYSDVLMETTAGGGRDVHLKRFEKAELNDHLMDVGISSISQCSEEDGTCEEMRKEIQLAPMVFPKDAMKFKYALDIDGNGWSSRFRRLIASGNVVLKSTIFPEWNSEWLTPWHHYVPINIDYSDLYHVATFFMGGPDGTPGNDDLARQISEAGVDFANKHWRWEDMQAYMFRLMLEYRRAMAVDRDAMSMNGKLHLS